MSIWVRKLKGDFNLLNEKAALSSGINKERYRYQQQQSPVIQPTPAK
jgi:hypothetical protein